jgi:hypothetical protein
MTSIDRMPERRIEGRALDGFFNRREDLPDCLVFLGLNAATGRDDTRHRCLDHDNSKTIKWPDSQLPFLHIITSVKPVVHAIN